MDVFDGRQRLQFFLNVRLQHIAHAASGRRHRHGDVDVVIAVFFCDLAGIDQTQIHNVHRNLRIVARAQHFPHLLLVNTGAA